MRLRDGTHGVHDAKHTLAIDRREVKARAASARRALAVTRELARQQAASERTPGQNRELLILGERNDLALEIAPGEGVVGLHALEAGDAAALADSQRQGDLPGGKVTESDVAHLARAHTVIERIECLFDRSQDRVRGSDRDRYDRAAGV